MSNNSTYSTFWGQNLPNFFGKYDILAARDVKKQNVEKYDISDILKVKIEPPDVESYDISDIWGCKFET